MTAPGWYPDPWRVAPARWWDGNQWTEHVQGPVQAAAPQAASPRRFAPRAEHVDVVVRGQVNSGPTRKKPFQVDAERFVVGEQELAVDDIETVAFWSVYEVKYGVQRYAVHVDGGERKLKVAWQGAKGSPQSDANWSGLMQILHGVVLPKVAGALAQRVLAGETVAVGTFDAVAGGISGRAGVSRVALPWHSLTDIVYEQGYVVVRGAQPSGQTVKMTSPMARGNAVVLPHLADVIRLGA